MWLRTCLILLLTICVQAAELINGGFELKPMGYPLVGWELLKGEIASVDLDRNVKRSGRQALSISHQTYSHTLVGQEFEVRRNTRYIVTLWVKSENVVASSDKTAGSCFIQDSSGSILATTPNISGTHDWEKISVFFSSKSENVRICLDFNMATGKLWFDDIVINEDTFGRDKETALKSGFPVTVQANYFAKAIYTQELGIKTLDIIQLSSASNPRFDRFYLNYSLIFAHQSDLPLNYYLWDGAPIINPGTGFENTQPNRSWTPYMTTLRVGVKENFKFFSEPIAVEFGTLNVLWSPYIAYFGGTQQGVGINNIKWNNFTVDGFWVWDPYVKLPAQSTPYRTGGRGLQIQNTKDNLKTKLILVQHYDANLNPQLETVSTFGDYPKDEESLAFELGYIGNGYRVNSTNIIQMKYTWGEKSEKVNAVYSATKTDFMIHLKNFKANFSYRNFVPGFAPRYRSYVPKYNHDRERLGQWNPITEFTNQKGFSTEITGSLLGKPIRFNFDHFLPHPSVDYRNNLALNLKGKTNFDMLFSYDQGKEEPIRYFEITANRQLLRQRFGTINGEVKFIQDNWYACPYARRDNFYNAIPMGPNHNLSPSAKAGLNASIVDLSLQVKLVRHLPGLNFTMGVQSASNRYHLYLNGELQLIKLLNIQFGYRTNDSGYGGDPAYGYWYDEYFRRHYPGTFIHCRTNLSF